MKLVTALSANYLPGFKALINSIKTHTQFDQPIAVIDCGIDPEQVKAIYPRSEIISPIEANYAKLPKSRHHLRSAFFKLEVFRLAAHQPVLFVDSDIVFTTSIKPLLTARPIAEIMLAYHHHYGQWNSGVMALRMQQTYQAMIDLMRRIERADTADQGIIEAAISKGLLIARPLATKWNTTKRQIKRRQVREWNCIHYVGASKPWLGGEDGYHDIEDVWWKYYRQT